MLNHWEANDIATGVFDRTDRNGRRPRRRRSLHKKEGAVNAIWVPLHHHGAIFQMGQQPRGNVRVILQKVALSQPQLWPENLSPIGKLYDAVFDAHLGVHHVVGILSWGGDSLRAHGPALRFELSQL